MIDSIFKFIADKFKEWMDKEQAINVVDKLTWDVGYSEKDFTCIKRANKVEIEGYIRVNGQLAPDVFVELFHVSDEIIPNKYIALATYGPASICIGLQTDGKAYIRNTGPKAMATGATVIFSGSWTVGGATLKLATLLHIRKEVATCL